ncbi:MAG: helix-turn-helix domain-containing protein [Candidatus Bathyarchaeota archaeon]
MRESKAKKRILETAEAMFKHVGYASLNINDVAHRAEVSIGTLYYHFPNGKQSILMEIRRQTAEHYERKFAERLDAKRLLETASFNEGLELLLRTLIDIHREQRPVLAATEIEVLSNLTTYSQLAESVDVGSLMESDARPVTDVLQALLDRHPDESLTLRGNETMLNKVVDVLIHRFVYFEPVFGSEQEFMDAMIKITRALMAL